ncbi:MAG: aminotransferase class I/II-fold pyridoxal phosphate-dependent enzyme, partial [Thermodesulfobacteria bacterium]|nr:aminotransferase class I/II-fold pyridoxal phosphate-dependent enzyme [Thermodesulfobacteriota bacterium]
LIDFLCRVFIRDGRNAISSRPSFLVYSKMVQITGGENRVVPLHNGVHHLDVMLDKIDENTRLIFLDNPNNPMGTVIKRGDMEKFLSRLPSHLLVILDEAYGEFVKPGTDWAEGINFFKEDKRVVILRTFSKAYGLAGLRVGYGIMDEDVASLLDRVRQPFNVNLPGQEGALAALLDRDHLESTLENTWHEMLKLFRVIKELGCTPYESNTNFMLIDTGRSARDFFEAMLRKGIIIRSMESYGFPTFIRVTIGTPEENQRFLDAFSEVLHQIPKK